jgi:hypothetical protein
VRSDVRVFAIVGLSALLWACGSKPPGVTGTDGEGGTTGNIIGGSAGANGIVFTDEPPPDTTQVCRTAESCEALECGPIADGCGDFIQCGGCEAPATCGGAGVPSHCGVPGTGDGTGGGGNCTPSTCNSLGVTCGQVGNGCGGVLTCGTCSANGEECVLGQCQQTSGCEPVDCSAYPEAGRCGPVSDGCSGILNCPFPACADNEQCGATEPGFCGVHTCTAVSCETALADKPPGYCGFVSDGCAGELQGCAAVCDANAGESCGVLADGGGYLQVCGVGSGGGCTPDDQAIACQGKCGVIGNGCSSTYDCGLNCAPGEVCGANGVANVCSAPTCAVATCQSLNAHCGTTDDGCGGTLDCGTCSTPGETCAGGGIAYQCGAPGCQPMDQATACTQANATCGLQSNGCGGTVNCGSCSNGETCGGGGVQNACGAPPCHHFTCEELDATCGPQGDGCGGQIDCTACPDGQVCRGTPSQCVPDVACTNFCQEQVTCSAGQETTVTGKVYAPNGTEPLFNALVYVPNIADLNSLPAISSGASCERCEDEDLGEPLVAAITGPDGSFSLKNVPAGVDFPLVVKMGKWRRVTMIPAIADCSSNVLNANDARLPRHRNDAAAGYTQFVSLPKMALVTGKVDAMECVLRKIGVADSEFSAPTGNGLIHLYQGQGNGSTTTKGAGTSRDGSNNAVGTSDSTLFGGTTLNNYDVAIFDCEGSEYTRTATRQNALNAYADAGGRVFASHYSYTYLDGVTGHTCSAGTCTRNRDCGGGSTCQSGHCTGSCSSNGNCGTGGVCSTTLNNSASYDFDQTATWFGSYNNEGPTTTGIIDVSHSKGQAFNTWLGQVNAWSPTYGDGNISITDPREFVQAATPDITERFVYTEANHYAAGLNANNSVQQYGFNTPVGAAPDAACGRVLYSAFHVAGANLDTHASVFPEECNNNPLTAQERVLEFMIFDLSSCVSTSVPPTCAPKTCGDVSANCGYVSDGCGGLLNCGTCQAPDTCGGGGTPNQCGSNCTLTSCAAKGATCGTIGDGCGGTRNCGTCSAPAVCGGGGTANVCGVPACTPRSCQSIGATCGNIGDGCGGTLNCGSCTGPAFCGGGGPNTCGSAACNPTGCGTAQCGSVGNGCGNAIDCGTCPAGSVCGARGPNKCGPVCTPQTCDSAGKNCGFIGDGCGGVLDCGTCSEGVVCGGGGVANVCGGSCSATTCAAQNANCGTLSDGCGGVLNCGTCPSGQVCGAQQPNQCGSGSCTPTSCGARCGIQSDGCSGTQNCGPCNGCVPLHCTAAVDCGPIADGCGSLIDCGVCTNGNTCGGGGIASKCGGGIQ